MQFSDPPAGVYAFYKGQSSATSSHPDFVSLQSNGVAFSVGEFIRIGNNNSKILNDL